MLAEDKVEEVDINNLPKKSFSQEQLTEVWMEYAYQIKKQDLDFFSTLSSFLPFINSEDNVEVTVHNSTQEADILKMKPELLTYVRKTIQNYDLDFEILVDKAEAKEIAVTPQEKYAKLVEKNPLLDDLRKKLDLGF